MGKTINQDAYKALNALLKYQPGLFAGARMDEAGGGDVAAFYFGFLRKFTELSASNPRTATGDLRRSPR